MPARQDQAPAMIRFVNRLSNRARLATHRGSVAGDRGAVSAEYGMLALFVAAAVVVSLVIFGDEILDLFSGIANDFERRPPPAPPD